MTHLMAKRILMTITLFIICSDECSGQNMDAIKILASCGNDCWTKHPENHLLEHISLEHQVFDETVVRCMQICFASKTKRVATEEKLPTQQIIKIKVSAFCGYICYNNNKDSKKALDFCYAGCLGTILQPRNKNSPIRSTMGTPTTTTTATSITTTSPETTSMTTPEINFLKIF